MSALRVKKSIALTMFLLAACVVMVFGAYQINQARQRARCLALLSEAAEGNNHQVKWLLHEGADSSCDCGEPVKAALKNGHKDTAALLKNASAKE